MMLIRDFALVSAIVLSVGALHAQGIPLVSRNGTAVADLHPSAYGRPILFPVRTPMGIEVTRNWPMKKGRAGEQEDHPHHKSIWFAHGDVNGHDFWAQHEHGGKIIPLESAQSEVEKTHRVVTRHQWVSHEGKVICTDERTISVRNDGPTNTIDYCVTLHASHGSLRLGDTKEGTMAIRMHPALRVKGKIANGNALNSEGDRGGKAWGKRAKWVHYSGTIADAQVSVSILDHPTNLRHPCWWHARTYGLVAANPLGAHHFERLPSGTGDLVIPAGESRSFRYRFLVTDGRLSSNQLNLHWQSFAETAGTRNPSAKDLSHTAMGKWRERLQQQSIQRWQDVTISEQRGHVLDALGLTPEPPKLDLDMRVHGEVTKGGIVLKRISFQSWPGHRAGGWMWTGRRRSTQPGPAVLCPHGHWKDGALHKVVRARATHLALMGARVLVVDNTHVENVAAGISSVGIMTWNNMRALDLLLSFKDVDSTRVGITGASGGAQQTMYMMAIENRIAAAAPICMITRFGEILREDSSHCECNHPPRMGFLGDEPLFCSLFVPRPVFYGSVTGDWTARFPSHGLKDIQSVYQSQDALERIAHSHRDTGHNYDGTFRREVYQFFKKSLGLSGTIHEDSDPDITLEACRSLGGPDRRAPKAKNLLAEFLDRRAALKEWSQLAPALSWQARRHRITIPHVSNLHAGYDDRELLSEGNVPIPIQIRTGADKKEGPWILVISPTGLKVRQSEIGHAVQTLEKHAVVTPRFDGPAKAMEKHWERNGLLLGCGTGYIMAHDIANAAESLPGNSAVRVMATGNSGPAALIAATLSARIESVVVPTYGASYSENGQRKPQLPEILRFGGINTVISRIPISCRLLIGQVPASAPWRQSQRKHFITRNKPLDTNEIIQELGR